MGDVIPFDGLAIRLLDVRLTEIMGQIQDFREPKKPDWLAIDGDQNGTLKILGVDDNVLIQFTAQIDQGQIALKIVLQGLYEVALESTVLHPKDSDHRWVVQRIPEDYKGVLIEQATRDLYPYLRHLAATISSQMDVTSRLVLAPRDQWDLLKLDP